MAVPRFLEYAESYQSPLAALSQGLGAGIQEGSQIADTMTKIRAEKDKKQADAAATAAKAASGGNLTGPAAQWNSYHNLRQQLTDGGHLKEVDQLDDTWNNAQNMISSRGKFYGANYWQKNWTQIQKNQFSANLNRENDARQKKGLVPLGPLEYAQATGLAPADKPAVKSDLSTFGDHADDQKAKDPGANLYTKSDYHQEALTDEYGLLKSTAPVKLQVRSSYGTIARVTLKNMLKDVDSTRQYTGFLGNLKHVEDYALSRTGNAPPEYVAYQRYKTNAKMLKQQIQNFYGASIQPNMMSELDALSNPEKYDKNVFKAKLYGFAQTFEQEDAKLKKSLKDPRVLTEKGKDLPIPEKYKAGQSYEQPQKTGDSAEKETAMKTLRKDNPKVSEKELSDYYDKKYGGK